MLTNLSYAQIAYNKKAALAARKLRSRLFAVANGTKTLLLWLNAAILLVGGLRSASACQYCRMGGDPQACLDLLKTDRSGALRLDAAIDKFKGAAAPTVPLAITTTAADLPARPVRRKPAPVSATPSQLQTHVFDCGLIGMAVAGGIFCWRTRRSDDDDAQRR